MDYYNRNFQKLELENMKYLSQGDCGEVSHNDEIILKEYFGFTNNSYRIKENIFDILKSIDDKHLIELYDIYTAKNKIKIFFGKLLQSQFKVDSYTAKYYSDNSVNALNEPKEYLLENLFELQKLFNILTENNICTKDVKRANTIIGKEGIVIIDPDLFYIPNEKENVALINQLNLLNLFKSICLASIDTKRDLDSILKYLEKEVLDFNLTEKTDISYEISKKLKYRRCPKDIFIH